MLGRITLNDVEMHEHNVDSALLRFVEGTGAAILDCDMETHLNSLRGKVEEYVIIAAELIIFLSSGPVTIEQKVECVKKFNKVMKIYQ